MRLAAALLIVVLSAGAAAADGVEDDWLSGLKHRFRISAGRFTLSDSAGGSQAPFFPSNATGIKADYALHRPRATEAVATGWYLDGRGQRLVCGTAEFRLRWNQGYVIGGYFGLGFGYGRNLTSGRERMISTSALGFESNTLFVELRSLADADGILSSTVFGIRF